MSSTECFQFCPLWTTFSLCVASQRQFGNIQVSCQDNLFHNQSVNFLDTFHTISNPFESILGSTKLHTIVFGTFLYQFHNMVLCASTYVTVVLALERYKAVWRPVEYRNSVLSGNPWRRVFIYIAPVVIFSVLFNIPKVNYHQHLTLLNNKQLVKSNYYVVYHIHFLQFFETEFATITIHNVTHFDETLNQTVYVNQTMDVLRASKLKLNSTYVVRKNIFDFYNNMFLVMH